MDKVGTIVPDSESASLNGGNKSSSTAGSSAQNTKDEANKKGGAVPIPKKKQLTFTYKPFEWYRLLIYDLFLWVFSIIFDCFFREIRPRGAFRLPRSGPVIFVGAPHANQFVDPIILMNQVKREANRRISFLIAAKSYKQNVIGHLAACELAIPVVRQQDNLVSHPGKIYVSYDEGSDKCIVHGKGTYFTRDCNERGMIALPQSLGASEIVEIISDTKLRIRKEFKNTEQVKKLLKNGTKYKYADKIDQKNVYQMVFKHLLHGNCLGIFPEGGSHDRPDLLPLKAGVAIMALGAMENDPSCNVKIVPCGMNYFSAHKFRSRAVVEFGAPIEIPKELVAKYRNPETNREAVKDLLDIITIGLKAVTVTCDDYETLMVVQAARRLYAGNFAQQLPLPLIVEMNRRLVLGYQTFRDNEVVQRVKSKIMKYNQMLKQLYLPDHSVEHCDELHKLRVLPVLIFRILKLVILIILSLPGATLFSPVFLCSKIVAKQKAKTALANSTVKIKANDVVATWKILISMVFAPLVYSFYASIGTWYYYHSESLYFTWLRNLNLWGLWFALYMCGVLVTYAALLTGEQGMDIFKSLRPLYLSLTSGESLTELKKLRADLAEEITSLVNTYGPELFPNDFNLLDMKHQLKVKDGVDYLDSDEEEERKTQDLRDRRIRRRKIEKAARNEAAIDDSTNGLPATGESTPSALSLEDKHSSSVSDGISLMNSDNSYTNIPMFSDYQLHANAKNPDFEVGTPNQFQLSSSIADDFNFTNLESREPSSMALNQHQTDGTLSPLPNHLHPNSISLNNESPALSRNSSSSHIELNFGKLANKSPKKLKLSDKIRNKVREGRKKMSGKDE